MDLTPCAKHDLWPCGECNGDQARLNASLEAERGEHEPGTRLGNGVVASTYPGLCVRCGQNYGSGSAIRWNEMESGWQATACCG